MNKKIEQLRKQVEKKNATMENRTCTIKGVSNLSRADRDSILMYIDAIETYGGFRQAGLVCPYGGVGEVLEKSGVIKESTMSGLFL